MQSSQQQELCDSTAKTKTTFLCGTCNRTFSTKGGRTNHQRKCIQKGVLVGNNTEKNKGAEKEEDEDPV